MSNIIKEIFYDYSKYSRRKFEPVYTSDPIINLLTYYKIWQDSGSLQRIFYDGDARYYYKHKNYPEDIALRGDTMISFYTPYKLAIELATGKVYNKTACSIDELIKNRNEPEYKKVNDSFTKFAAIYHTPGNYILLPPHISDNNMNPARYSCSEDRIDKSLFECFPGGALSKYFSDEDQLIEWIKEQKLDVVFENRVIEKDKIIPFNRKRPYARYYSKNFKPCMGENELYEFLNNTVDLINYRNKTL